MKEYLFDNIHEAYLHLLRDVYMNPEYESSPRGLRAREKLNCMIKIQNPASESLITRDLERNRLMSEYLEKERKLYKGGFDKAVDFADAGKLWLSLANPDGTINSAYGKSVWYEKSAGSPVFNGGAKITQWEWAKRALQDDQYSRQSFILLVKSENQWSGNKDVPCTMHGNFMIRDNKLSLTIVMRSNDLVLGFPYDVPWFISLMDDMVAELRDVYPNLIKGEYIHIVHNLHIYEKDFSKVIKMIGS